MSFVKLFEIILEDGYIIVYGKEVVYILFVFEKEDISRF